MHCLKSQLPVRRIATLLLAASLTTFAACGGGSSSAPPAGGGDDDPIDPPPPVVLTPATPVASTNIAFEPKSGGRVWVVNQDNDSVSVIDPQSQTRIGEIAVGSAPRTVAIGRDGRVWVANRDSATISQIDATTLSVAATFGLPVASQPFAVIESPADGGLWVSLQATDEIVRLNPADGQITHRVAGDGNVRHLSMPATGDRLLAPRFISPPLPDEATATPKSEVAGVQHGGEMLVIDPASASVSSTVVLRASVRSDSSVGARGIPNYVGAAAISPDGTEAWLPSKQDNVFRGSARVGPTGLPQQPVNFEATVRAVSSRLALQGTPAEQNIYRIDHDNSSLASAAVYDPSGVYVIVALETSREFALVDPLFYREVAKFQAGIAPQGVSISADGKWLAVNNFMDRTVGLYDLTALVGFNPGQSVITKVADVATVGTEKLAAQVLRGKKLFYDAADPRLSLDKYMSCASCHNDGGHDGRVWDFTSFNGVDLAEGLRNTISLRGRGGNQMLLHWSGNFDEIQDFETQIRNFAGGTGLIDVDAATYAASSYADALGAPKAGLSADLDALAAYIQSLTVHAPSPWRGPDRQLTAGGLRGSSLFVSKGCASCHAGADFAGTDPVAENRRRDIGTITALSGYRFGGPLDAIDIPTLRDAWNTAPYLHDGSAATLGEAISRHAPAVLSGGAPTSTELADLVEYVRQIGSEEPAR